MKIIKTLWKNNNNEIRNGWWILLFIALVAISRPIFSFTNTSLKQAGFTENWLVPLPFLFILFITWICLRCRKEKLSDVGLQINGAWFAQLGLGYFIGCAQIALVVLAIWLTGSISFNSNTNFTYEILLLGFYTMAFASLMEELLFRGYIFQRLISGIGFWFTQLLLATAFSVGHFTDLELSLETRLLGGLDLILFALLMGVAYQKTKSLALPIGIHFGWNWFQGHVLGIPVSGHNQEGIFSATIENAPVWLNGGSFGAEASIFAIASEVILLVILIKWKGTHQAKDAKYIEIDADNSTKNGPLKTA